MDKKEDFAERRARQKEKLRAQRAERRVASSTNAESGLATPSSTPLLAKADSAADSEGNDFVHVEKEDAAQADLGVVSTQAPFVAKLHMSPVSFPAKHKAETPASSPSAPKPISKTEDGIRGLHLGSLKGAVKQQQGAPGSESSPAGSSRASTAQADAAGQALAAATQGVQQSTAGRSLSAAQPAQQPKGSQTPVGEVREPKPGSAGEALQARPATPSKTPVLQQQSAAGKSFGALPDATASHNSASAASQQVRRDQMPSSHYFGTLCIPLKYRLLKLRRSILPAIPFLSLSWGTVCRSRHSRPALTNQSARSRAQSSHATAGPQLMHGAGARGGCPPLRCSRLPQVKFRLRQNKVR